MSGPPDVRRRSLASIAVALASVASATALTSALWPLLMPGATPLFFAAVVVSSWFGGMRPGLLATVLSARRVLTAALAHMGAAVTAVASAREALDAVHRETPDVVVSDIRMPGEDGYAFIRKLRALAPERGGRPPAVALTAYPRVEDRAGTLEAGFQMHVPKPVQPNELAAVVAALAGRAESMA